MGTHKPILAVLIAALAWGVGSVQCDPPDTPQTWTRGAVRTVAGFAAIKGLRLEERPLAFPEGDIGAFCRWMAEPKSSALWEAIPSGWKDEQRGVLIDQWGKALVYRSPSARQGAMFDLYSVGPNGLDEGGGGDDITCGAAADFAEHAHAFKGGIVDVQWIRAHMHELQRDAAFEIIGAPPEKLKDIE